MSSHSLRSIARGGVKGRPSPLGMTGKEEEEEGESRHGTMASYRTAREGEASEEREEGRGRKEDARARLREIWSRDESVATTESEMSEREIAEWAEMERKEDLREEEVRLFSRGVKGQSADEGRVAAQGGHQRTRGVDDQVQAHARRTARRGAERWNRSIAARKDDDDTLL